MSTEHTAQADSGELRPAESALAQSRSAQPISPRPDTAQPYSAHTRVLHLGNVAGTGRNLVAAARRKGRNWALRELPAAPSLRDVSAWRARGVDALRYAAGHAAPELAHIHYGPNGYYGALKRAPFVLHLHGTDLRQDLGRPLVGDLERWALRHAAAVVVATPDLLELAQSHRADAIWVPNCLPLDLTDEVEAAAWGEGESAVAGVGAGGNVGESGEDRLRSGPTPANDANSPGAGTPEVFFASRWDDSKGGTGLVDLAADLVRDGVSVAGIDWGQHATAARRAGVRLAPKLDAASFRAAMSEADLVVGQFRAGALGISDLEAMALGRPLVTWLAPGPESGAPVVNVQAEEAFQSVRTLLGDASARGALGGCARTWVLSERSPSAAVTRLDRVYQQILG